MLAQLEFEAVSPIFSVWRLTIRRFDGLFGKSARDSSCARPRVGPPRKRSSFEFANSVLFGPQKCRPASFLPLPCDSFEVSNTFATKLPCRAWAAARGESRKFPYRRRFHCHPQRLGNNYTTITKLRPCIMHCDQMSLLAVQVRK